VSVRDQPAPLFSLAAVVCTFFENLIAVAIVSADTCKTLCGLGDCHIIENLWQGTGRFNGRYMISKLFHGFSRHKPCSNYEAIFHTLSIDAASWIILYFLHYSHGSIYIANHRTQLTNTLPHAFRDLRPPGISKII
jgi:hypothetical protein